MDTLLVGLKIVSPTQHSTEITIELVERSASIAQSNVKDLALRDISLVVKMFASGTQLSTGVTTDHVVADVLLRQSHVMMNAFQAITNVVVHVYLLNSQSGAVETSALN